jgi:NAD-dependent SIR2 family protein deacetylase
VLQSVPLNEPSQNDLAQWEQVLPLFRRGKIVVLTGAGVSTDSGVPGYRDETGAWKGAAPIQFDEFVNSLAARQRYWARSHVGFARMGSAEPNRAHLALHALEEAGHIELLVTQNVDGLHQRAGSQNVLDLHGRLSRVVCMSCGYMAARSWLQQVLDELNVGWRPDVGSSRPDGDADVAMADVSHFQVADCPSCRGVLKPDVVFFGERVPPERHVRANTAIERANALLVVGSSLVVNSGYRLIRTAQGGDVPIIVVNRGVTRADPSAVLKLEGNASELLDALCRALGVRTPTLR